MVWGSNPDEGKTFCVCSDCPKAHLASRTKCTRTLSQEKRPRYGVNHAPTSKKEYSYTSTTLLGLHGLLEGELCFLMSTLYIFLRHIIHMSSLCDKKAKWSRYRPGVAQRVGRGIALLFHDLSTRWGEWSAARSRRTLPRERPSTHFIGGWEGPRAGLDGWKISPPPGFNPGPSSP